MLAAQKSRSPCYSPLAVLDTLVLRPYSGPYTTTCDSYFGSVAWLSAHPLAPSFHALSSTTCPFYELLKYDLQPDTYRVFSNGSVHISIWFDVEIHVCATNAVAAVSSAVSSSPSPLLGTSFLQVQQLPTTLIPILMQASTDDLKALAGRAGTNPSWYIVSWVSLVHHHRPSLQVRLLLRVLGWRRTNCQN